MQRCKLLSGVAAALVGIAAIDDVSAEVLFRDQMLSGVSWGVNASSVDHAATFGYDYSADFIPEAPHSQLGDVATRGVKLEANIVAPDASVVFTLFPIAQNFNGNYQLRFDAWMNYDADERINGGSAGTAEFIGGRIGYDDIQADIGIGSQILATGDGGSGSDWRVFADNTFLAPADMAAGDRNGFNPYYSDFLPGVAPPAGQAQISFPEGTAGSPGFQWITFEINTEGGVSSVYIEKPTGERLLIAEFVQSTFGSSSNGNIGLMYADFFTSVSPRPDLTFGLIDNVEVRTIPPPVAPQLKINGKTKLTTSRAKITVRGTTADDGEVVRVEIKSNSGKKGYRKVVGTSRWKKRLRLKEGRNVFKVRALDDDGLFSSIERIVVKRE